MELALNSVALAAVGGTTLVLCGKAYMVPIAQALHRRVRDPDRPFVVVELRRGEQRASVRSPASPGNTVVALEAARRGTCCICLRCAPADLAEMHRAADDVMVVICGGLHRASDALSIQAAPVVVPLLSSRVHELDRIIIQYAGDAIAELGAPRSRRSHMEHQVRQAGSAGGGLHQQTDRGMGVRRSRELYLTRLTQNAAVFTTSQ